MVFGMKNMIFGMSHQMKLLPILEIIFLKDATDELDEDVNLYFFYITAPAVLWRQDDGSYYGS